MAYPAATSSCRGRTAQEAAGGADACTKGPRAGLGPARPRRLGLGQVALGAAAPSLRGQLPRQAARRRLAIPGGSRAETLAPGMSCPLSWAGHAGGDAAICASDRRRRSPGLQSRVEVGFRVGRDQALERLLTIATCADDDEALRVPLHPQMLLRRLLPDDFRRHDRPHHPCHLPRAAHGAGPPPSRPGACPPGR